MLNQGTLFDNRYQLQRLLGRGGFAEVWLVYDTLSGLEEALKIYAPGSGMDEDGLKLFVKELSVVHDLRHSNLLTPKMLGQCDNQPYLIMPFCPNGSLNKKVGQCSENEAWKILGQVAAGLDYLHQRNIVHQDIKPDNILIDANNDYVITDFGISLKAQSTLRKSVLLQANSGTMAYMAPERFSKEPHPIPANDVWSLGAMMFELIEGNVPFMAALGGLAQQNGAQIPTMHSGVSDQLKQIIISMLDGNSVTRPNATQIVEIVKENSAQQPNMYAQQPTEGIQTRVLNRTIFSNSGTMQSVQEERKTQMKIENHNPISSYSRPNRFLDNPEQSQPQNNKTKAHNDKPRRNVLIVCIILVIVAIVFLLMKCSDNNISHIETPRTETKVLQQNTKTVTSTEGFKGTPQKKETPQNSDNTKQKSQTAQKPQQKPKPNKETKEEVITAPLETFEEEEDVVFVVVESMPEFPGGQPALFKYLSENVKYPVIAQENGIQGRVICQFVVNKDGSIVDVEVVRSGGDPSLDNEALRVVRSMPKWKPGKQRGKTVRVKYTVPVNFKLQ